MVNLRRHIEKWFEHLGHVIYRNPIKTLLVMLVVIAAMASQVPKITIDTSTEGFLHENDPILAAYNAFRDQFGRDELIIVAINPPNVFDQTFLKKLKALHEDLEENVPHIDDITSLVNARNTRGERDELIVEDLLENWPETKGEMEALKARVLSSAMYQNNLISQDGRFTTIVIKTDRYSSLGQDLEVLEGFEDDTPEDSGKKGPDLGKQPYLTDRENGEAVMAVQRILRKYEAPDFPVYLAGSPVVTHFLKRTMLKDMRKFMGLAVVTIAVFLFVMFRRISGVLLPLFLVILSLLSTLGIMAAARVPIKLPTQILPSFLLAVCVGASVHILAIFYLRYQQSRDKQDAIAYALGHSGLAVVMTSVTTAAGLVSFLTADVAPIAEIGMFASTGVMLGLIYTLVGLPALLALVPIKNRPFKGGARNATLMDRFLARIGSFSTGHPGPILVAAALIVAVSITAALKIRFSHHVLGWFPEKNEIRSATERIDHELRGSITLEVVVDTGRENGLYEPDILNRLEKATADIEPLELEGVFAGKAWSLTTILKEINQALNENRPDFYTVPQNRELVAQEFLLFENTGSDDLEDVVDSQFSMARFTIKVPFRDAVTYRAFDETVDRYFKENFPEANVTFTGLGVLLIRTVLNTITSMAKSYLIALVVVTILMILLIGRVRIGMLSMIPNLAPILLTLGVMGAFSIPMDLFTMMVGSIAIGLAVDDTIHFMHNFRRYYEDSGDPKEAVQETLHTTGRAMLVTSVVLSLGFFIFTFATMNNLFNFGLLTAFTIAMALAADYLIAPALMVLVNRRKTN